MGGGGSTSGLRRLGMDFVEQVLSASCRSEVAQKNNKEKLRGKKLLLESVTTRVAPGETARKKSRSASVRRGVASRKERRALLLKAVRAVTHEQLQRQHTAWSEYVKSSLSTVPPADRPARLVTLDWHGAHLRVAQCSSPSHASAQGLVLAETRRMLLLLSASRRVWVPKAGTVVEIALPDGSAVRCEAERTRPEPEHEAPPPPK